MSRPFRVTRAQARELRAIKDRTTRSGGIPHDEVVRRMHERVTRDLRRMVKAYKHPGREINDILELLALSHAEGLKVEEPLNELLGKIADKARAA